MPGFDWRWCAEIDPFASAVLAHRFPHVPNLGDVTKLDPMDLEPVDVLVFGSPCQSFSVAGCRLGLDDPRGNLALVALGIVAAIRPRWFVFENVPGLLSSGQRRDFGAFLRQVEDIGYSGCWRVLDAQYFGVPQRRRRIFFVGYLGDWRPAAAVLFERESLRGDIKAGREAGEGVAGGAGRGAAFGGNNTRGPISVATAVNAHGGPYGRLDFESETFIALSCKDHGADAGDLSPTLRAMPLHPAQGRPPLAVRRLTPREAERLQGFPDDWTLVTYRGKPAADGPRYKALGNSMAVPVMEYILSRLNIVDVLA